MMPSLVAIGTYAILLAWNEYLYAFLLLSKDTEITLPVALGNFLAADDSPWELLMTTGFIYALPPAAIYYAFKRYMVGGLTAGAVKSLTPAYSGAALSPCELDSFEANEAITITTAISAITMVQIALISGFTPSRTSE